jgi:hypothetical protein
MFAKVLVSLVLFITIKKTISNKKIQLYVLFKSDSIELYLSLQSVDQNLSFLAKTWNEKRKEN